MDGADTPAGDDDGVAADVAAAVDGSIARFRSALADVVSPREAALAGAVAANVRGRTRDARELASSPPEEILGALRRSMAGVVAAARPGGSSSRLAVTLALLVVASGTLTLVGTAPAAAIFGDNDRTTYTLDVGEIQLDDGGQICAAPVGDGTYRVLITDATLVDTTVYQQRGDDAVKTDLPTLDVDDAIVMYTSAEDEDFDLLATTMGCTDEDQTSRTVFQNRYQTGSMLHGSEGLTMQNMQSTDGTVPEAGGFQFVAPDENGSSSPMNVTGGVEQIADDVDDVLNGSLVDRLENGTDDGLGVNETVDGVDETVEGVNETVRNVTDGQAGTDAVENATNTTGEAVSTVGETVANTTADTVENTSREVAGGDPPENVSGTVDDTTDVVDTTTGEVENTTDDVTDATDEVANSTGDETTSTVVDNTTDVVDGTTDAVTNTTDAVTDGVDETTDQVVRPVEETATPESTETSEPTPSPTEVPITPTEVLTPTETPEDETPEWLEGVDDDERTSVLETIEETEGGFDSVENVTEETDGYSEEAIDGDENLTRLDNGTVLLLNGTDPGLIDWGTLADTLDTGLTSTDDTETEAKDGSGDGSTATETDDGGTLFG